MTIIKDPALEPFYIGKDAHCYTVYEVITPQAKYLDEGSEGKNYEKPVGHYSDFGSALKRVMRAQVNQTEKVYDSVQSYIDEWIGVNNKLNKLINIESRINTK
jgi:hypothetical protein|tara:strand:- start:430 stop:738 length:309 start_codon:yes stop_codon:yes gene_type:complete